MEDHKNKESYMQRKAQQLMQWERVIDTLQARADKAKDKSKSDLRRHIVKIQVIKARTAVILNRLRNADNGNWDNIKADLEKSWGLLRKAFSNASARPK